MTDALEGLLRALPPVIVALAALFGIGAGAAEAVFDILPEISVSEAALGGAIVAGSVSVIASRARVGWRRRRLYRAMRALFAARDIEAAQRLDAALTRLRTDIRRDDAEKTLAELILRYQNLVHDDDGEIYAARDEP